MVIVLVLGMLAVALVLATQLGDAAAGLERTVRFVRAREENYLVARSALEMGIELLRADDNEGDGLRDTWAMGELEVEWEHKTVRLSIIDEESRFPLNRLIADPDGESELQAALVRLLQRAGAPAEEAVDTLLDWVDADTLRRPRGAETGDAGARTVKNGPLDSLAELRWLPAWEAPPAFPPPVRPRRGQALLQEALGEAAPPGELPPPSPRQETSRWSDWLTLHSSGKVNLNTAPAELIRALDPEITQVTLEELLARRQQENLTSSQNLRAIPGVDADMVFRLEKLAAYTSHYFELRATVDEPPGRVVLVAVVKREGGRIEVVSWHLE